MDCEVPLRCLYGASMVHLWCLYGTFAVPNEIVNTTDLYCLWAMIALEITHLRPFYVRTEI